MSSSQRQESAPLSGPPHTAARTPALGRPATALPGSWLDPADALLRRPPPRPSRPAPPPKRACCYARETGGDREGVGEKPANARVGGVRGAVLRAFLIVLPCILDPDAVGILLPPDPFCYCLVARLSESGR